MKTSIAFLLTLFLMATLFTGCGEDNTTHITTTDANLTTTVTEGTGTTVSANATTTTVVDATTTKRPTTDHVNGTGGTSAVSTTTTTTATTKPIVSTVDPHNYKDTYYYVGALQPDGTGLVRPRVLFEGEYAVIMHYMYSATKEEDDQPPFNHQGKTYYGQGEGMSPYLFELTATEIVVKDQNNNDAAVMKLVLQSDGNMRVISTTDNYFPVGLILEPNAQ